MIGLRETVAFDRLRKLNPQSTKAEFEASLFEIFQWAAYPPLERA
jgi:hypothetical protein